MESLSPVNAWRRVEVGLWMKLAALLLGIASGTAALYGMMRGDVSLTRTAMYSLVACAGLDVLGRWMCLFGPRSVANRRRIVTSVLCQGAALGVVVVLAVLAPARFDAWIWVGLALAVLLQFGAAVFFVLHLGDLSKALEDDDLKFAASYSLDTLGAFAGAIAGSVGVVGLMFALLWLAAFNLLLWCLGYLVALIVGFLLVLAIALVLLLVYVAYGVALTRIAREIHRRISP